MEKVTREQINCKLCYVFRRQAINKTNSWKNQNWHCWFLWHSFYRNRTICDLPTDSKNIIQIPFNMVLIWYPCPLWSRWLDAPKTNVNRQGQRSTPLIKTMVRSPSKGVPSGEVVVVLKDRFALSDSLDFGNERAGPHTAGQVVHSPLTGTANPHKWSMPVKRCRSPIVPVRCRPRGTE